MVFEVDNTTQELLQDIQDSVQNSLGKPGQLVEQLKDEQKKISESVRKLSSDLDQHAKTCREEMGKIADKLESLDESGQLELEQLKDEQKKISESVVKLAGDLVQNAQACQESLDKIADKLDHICMAEVKTQEELTWMRIQMRRKKWRAK